MKASIILVAAAAVLTSCNEGARQQQAPKTQHPASTVDHTPPIPPPGTGPDARTPLGEPNHAIDPKSIEAARQVVQRFGALIEHNRLDEAERLWGSADSAAAFVKELRPSTHLDVGEAGEPEGAAGSVYTVVPVVFYADRFRRSAKVVLRRVNDVPGSSDEQRHWHIERIDWSGRT
jgi:hypothetical protein